MCIRDRYECIIESRTLRSSVVLRITKAIYSPTFASLGITFNFAGAFCKPQGRQTEFYAACLNMTSSSDDAASTRWWVFLLNRALSECTYVSKCQMLPYDNSPFNSSEWGFIFLLFFSSPFKFLYLWPDLIKPTIGHLCHRSVSLDWNRNVTIILHSKGAPAKVSDGGFCQIGSHFILNLVGSIHWWNFINLKPY